MGSSSPSGNDRPRVRDNYFASRLISMIRRLCINVNHVDMWIVFGKFVLRVACGLDRACNGTASHRLHANQATDPDPDGVAACLWISPER